MENNHYYTKKPTSKSNEILIQYTIFEKTIPFYTDNGVFSKNKIDFGSDFLVKTFIKCKKNIDNKALLDIGCGYGVVGITLKKFFPNIKLTMTDINERALDLTEKNILNNHLDKINVYQSFLFEDIKDNFDFILSNPPIRSGKQNIFKLYEEAYLHLNNMGELYVVIQKKQGAKSTLNELQNLFGNVEKIDLKDGYWILKSIKKEL